MTKQNSPPRVRMFHQGCVRNLRDEQNKKLKKPLKPKNPKKTIREQLTSSHEM